MDKKIKKFKTYEEMVKARQKLEVKGIPYISNCNKPEYGDYSLDIQSLSADSEEAIK